MYGEYLKKDNIQIIVLYLLRYDNNVIKLRKKMPSPLLAGRAFFFVYLLFIEIAEQ